MTSCVVDVSLDQPRTFHTGDGDLVCGGEDDGNGNHLSTCYNILTGTTINLNNERSVHISWSTADELYLIGGNPSSNYRTTELISGGSTQAGFSLKYDTRYELDYY